jgi:hypothetical protein
MIKAWMLRNHVSADVVNDFDKDKVVTSVGYEHRDIPKNVG